MTNFYEICALCGPRKISSDDIPALLIRLDHEIGWLITQNVTRFRIIPSPGFNFFAALTVLNLKRNFPETELEVIVGNFNNNLKSEDIEVRDFIISHADLISEIRIPPRGLSGNILSEVLTKDCSYLITYAKTDLGFCSHARERADICGQQIIYTEKSCVGVSV